MVIIQFSIEDYIKRNSIICNMLKNGCGFLEHDMNHLSLLIQCLKNDVLKEYPEDNYEWIHSDICQETRYMSGKIFICIGIRGQIYIRVVMSFVIEAINNGFHIYEEARISSAYRFMSSSKFAVKYRQPDNTSDTYTNMDSFINSVEADIKSSQPYTV